MKKVLVIGAGFLQAFVIRKAKEMGYYTLTVDADPEAVGFLDADEHAVINIVDEEACLAYAKEKEIDGVLTAATDYGVLTAAYVSEKMSLPGIPYEVAKVIKNKYLTRKCLFENHVDDTKQAYCVEMDTDMQALAEELTYPVMVKPCDGSGSRGASRVDRAEEFVDAAKTAIASSLTKRATVESFVEGREYGAETIVVKGEPHVLAIMQKWMTKPPYYAELGHAIPNDLSEEVENRAKECVAKAIKALGITSGSVNMDMLITEEGAVHIVDIGARMGGNLIGSHIIPLGTGIDYMGAMIRTAVGDEVQLVAGEKTPVATKLLAFGAGSIAYLPDMEELSKKYQVEITHHMEAGAPVREYHNNLDGLGYVIATSADVQEAEARAEQVRQEIAKCIF